MKKLVVLLVVFFAVMSLSADPIQLGTFPVGKWLDSNWDAVWEFSSDNIRILGKDGSVLFNFAGKSIQNFKVFLEGVQPGISFNCPEAGRSYRFLKAAGINTDVIMEIDRPDLPKYSVTMKKQ